MENERNYFIAAFVLNVSIKEIIEVTAEMVDDPHDIIRLYLSEKHNHWAIPLYLNRLNKIMETSVIIDMHLADIKILEDRINALTSDISPIIMPDIKALNKIMSRMKGKAEFNEMIELTFYNVKVGSDETGYIVYKSIIVYYKPEVYMINGSPFNIVLNFQNFTYDTNKWFNIVGKMIPIGMNMLFIQDWVTDDENKLSQIRNSLLWYSADLIESITKKIHILDIVFRDYKKTFPTKMSEEMAEQIFTNNKME